jgi:choloylglycine hydrolase
MCTSFRLSAGDGTVVVGRTMEFPNLMGARITALPIGYEGTGIGVDGASGKTWTSTYGIVGMNAFGEAGLLTDGMNDHGVYAGLLYMPGFCDYTPAEGADPSSLMSIVDSVAYLLGTSASIADAKAAMAGVTVWPYVFGPFGFAPPAHLVVHDRTGASAVFEWRDGQMVVFDNPIGVATNSPHLDWHLTNLRNYVNLTTTNPATRTIQGVELAPVGQGPGMNGLPGDSSPPSRFLRATALSASIRPVETGAELENTALHVLNNFDLPHGYVRDGDDPANDDRTLWSTIANLKDLRYVVRTYENPIPQAIDLANVDFQAEKPIEVDLPTGTFATLALG